ncbi:MAG TPA: SDR family oxidoreductase [Dehalococcoidia bacterium]|nr:SDR family oxidoreductase [Dehalococcoidia bacterium]
MARSIVVTGSAAGIGQATAALLTAAGQRVIGVDRHNAEVIADLATPQGRAAMIAGVQARAGGAIDAVVACAGIARPDGLTVSVNYFGAIVTLEGLRPLLDRGDRPRALAISSITATSPINQYLVEACLRGDEWAALQATQELGHDIYAATKAAVARWVRQRAIRPEWVGRGILLNAVAPGYIATPMTQSFIHDVITQAGQQGTMPIGRPGQPEEIAHLIAFLISPENSYMVGQIVFSDGGLEASSRGDHVW